MPPLLMVQAQPYSGHLVIKENKIDSIHQEDSILHMIQKLELLI